MRIKLGVFFGGKSVEHEVSIITAIQAMESMNEEKYEIIPVYISKDEKMFVGKELRNIDEYKNLPELIKKSTRVIPMNEDGKLKLLRHPMKKFGDNQVAEIEVAFLAGHGTNVEDGALQGWFQSMGIAYTGSDVLSSAIGMNKYVMKILLHAAGIPVLPAIKISSYAYSKDKERELKKIFDKFPYPVIVKPVNLGSSIGVTVANDFDGLTDAVEHAFLFAGEILVEKAITNLREINVSVLGDSESAVASECEEPISTKEILDFEDKYLRSSKNGKGLGEKSSGMASLSRKIPAEISKEMREKIRRFAVSAFQTIGCNGVARIDFMIDSTDNSLYLTEINTLPGSLSFYLWEPVGLKYSELIDKIISLALKRRRFEGSVNYSFQSNILSGYTGGSQKSGKQ